MSTPGRWSRLGKSSGQRRYCIYTVDMGPYKVKVLVARLPGSLDPERVASVARSTGSLIIGVDRDFKPCTVASAALHAMELAGLGVLRVKSRPLAALMLLYGARQISEVIDALGSVDRVIGVDVDPSIFEEALKSLTGMEWEGDVCRATCGPEDLSGVARIASSML